MFIRIRFVWNGEEKKIIVRRTDKIRRYILYRAVWTIRVRGARFITGVAYFLFRSTAVNHATCRSGFWQVFMTLVRITRTRATVSRVSDPRCRNNGGHRLTSDPRRKIRYRRAFLKIPVVRFENNEFWIVDGFRRRTVCKTTAFNYTRVFSRRVRFPVVLRYSNGQNKNRRSRWLENKLAFLSKNGF